MDRRNSLIEAMRDLNEERLFSCIEDLITSDFDRRTTMQWLQEGMIEVGKLFEQGEYFIADLIVAGTLFREAISLFPHPKTEKKENLPLGCAVIGVMRGDIHDIGKDIVCQTMESEGFNVIDLGVDVSTQAFLDAIQKYSPDFVILCGMMSYAIEGMRNIIEKLREYHLRDACTVIVGGGCMDSTTSREIGADYYTKDPIENVQACKKIMDGKRHDGKRHDG